MQHNLGQPGCFCPGKGQSGLTLLCLCCRMGVAQWRWLPWVKLVLMEKCVGFRPQHSPHESNTIRHSRFGSGWDFELVFDCAVRPMNPRSNSCHPKFRSRWRLTSQYTFIYIYMAGHLRSNMLSRKMFLTFPGPQICFVIYISGLFVIYISGFDRWNAVQAMSDPKELDQILPGEAKRQREALRRKLQSPGPSQKNISIHIWCLQTNYYSRSGTYGRSIDPRSIDKSPNHCLQPRAQAGPGGKVCSSQNRSRKVISSGSELQDTWDHKCSWFVEVWVAQTFHHGSHSSECGGRGIFHAAEPSVSSNSKTCLKAEKLYTEHIG